jgi:hypothetical protein
LAAATVTEQYRTVKLGASVFPSIALGGVALIAAGALIARKSRQEKWGQVFTDRG